MLQSLIFLYAAVSVHYIAHASQELNTTDTHWVLISSPFFGHIIPLLDLAKVLSSYHHVTFVVSASKLHVLRQRGILDSVIQSSLEFIGLLDGNDDEYQMIGIGTTINIPTVLERMEEPIRQALFSDNDVHGKNVLPRASSVRRPITTIVSDLFVLSPMQEAHQRKIRNYFFLPTNLMAFTNYLNSSAEKLSTSNRADFFFDHQLHEMLSTAHGLICNSIHSLDAGILSELRQSNIQGSRIPVLFVAPLISEDIPQEKDSQGRVPLIFLNHWLDMQWEKANQSPGVIYIGFGSLISLNMKQIIEIVDAFKPYSFIWSLDETSQRFVRTLGIDGQKHFLLDWPPQRFILSHRAIRLFVSHGGWNSVLESMLHGKPILVWPQFGDQTINAHRIEKDLGMGRCIKSQNSTSEQIIVTRDEWTHHLEEIFTQENQYFERARFAQQMMMDAKQTSSRKDLETLMNINSSVASNGVKRKIEL